MTFSNPDNCLIIEMNPIVTSDGPASLVIFVNIFCKISTTEPQFLSATNIQNTDIKI